MRPGDKALRGDGGLGRDAREHGTYPLELGEFDEPI